jgi:branched-chain amino acid transport system ATP-binding protein
MLLQIKNLKVRYKGAEVLKGVSLEMKQGEMTTLIGSNGAGKTTTLRTISGLKRADEGTIRFKQQDIHSAPPVDIVKQGLSQVPSGRALFSHMSVLENIKMGGYLVRDKRKRDESRNLVFSTFPVLKDRTHQLAGYLSGGEQQMLAIAMALMSNPTLLLLDEPSTGLSPRMVTEIGKVIRQIHQNGTAVLLVEQNARLALSLAQSVYVMETGMMVLHGTPDQLKDSDQLRKAYLGL